MNIANRSHSLCKFTYLFKHSTKQAETWLMIVWSFYGWCRDMPSVEDDCYVFLMPAFPSLTKTLVSPPVMNEIKVERTVK